MDPLPIRVQPHADESGHGFALRTLHRNGLTFSKAAYWMGINWTKSISAQHVRQWAWALQAPPEWMNHHIPLSWRDDGHVVSQFMGLAWQGGLRIRVHRPQVCIRCIHQHGYCRAAWDLQMACICPHHACLLIETCSYCGKALQWNRLSVDVCACGRVLKAPSESHFVDPELLEWTEWLESRLLQTPSQAGSSLMGIPASVTPDGLFALLVAFGVKSHAQQSLPPTFWRTRLSSSKTSDILLRGLNRLRSAHATGQWSDLADLADEPTLRRLCDNGVHAADRDIGAYITRRMYGSPTQRGPKPKGQLELPLGDAP